MTEFILKLHPEKTPEEFVATSFYASLLEEDIIQLTILSKLQVIIETASKDFQHACKFIYDDVLGQGGHDDVSTSLH